MTDGPTDLKRSWRRHSHRKSGGHGRDAGLHLHLGIVVGRLA